MKERKLNNDQKIGVDLLNEILLDVRKELLADYTFISIAVDGSLKKLKTVSVCSEQVLENFEYTSNNGPCSKVLRSEICVFPSKVESLFPDDAVLQNLKVSGYLGYPLYSLDGQRIIGVVGALYTGEIPEQDTALRKIKLLVPRIEYELERHILSSELQYLDRSKERLKLAMTSTKMGGWDFFISENRLEFDDAKLSLYGLTKKTFNNTIEGWLERIHEDDRSRVLNNVQTCISKNGSPYIDDYKIVLPTGEVRHVTTRGLFFIENDKVERGLGLTWDITNQKKHEKSLIEAKNKLIKEKQIVEIQREELLKKNEEKTAMMKEIHHRIKNNLQVVNSLLQFQSYEVEDEKVVSMFKECQNRVLSMALLHEKMYQSDDLHRIDVKEHITLLAEDLVKTYEIGKDTKLNINIQDLNIGIRTLVPLGLIINEIIANSLKYAFKDMDNGEITIQISQLENDFYSMVIGDNGVGLKDKEESRGIGTKIIQSFTKQLKGTFIRIHKPGTIFKLTFKNLDIN